MPTVPYATPWQTGPVYTTPTDDAQAHGAAYDFDNVGYTRGLLSANHGVLLPNEPNVDINTYHPYSYEEPVAFGNNWLAAGYSGVSSPAYVGWNNGPIVCAYVNLDALQDKVQQADYVSAIPLAERQAHAEDTLEWESDTTELLSVRLVAAEYPLADTDYFESGSPKAKQYVTSVVFESAFGHRSQIPPNTVHDEVVVQRDWYLLPDELDIPSENVSTPDEYGIDRYDIVKKTPRAGGGLTYSTDSWYVLHDAIQAAPSIGTSTVSTPGYGTTVAWDFPAPAPGKYGRRHIRLAGVYRGGLNDAAPLLPLPDYASETARAGSNSPLTVVNHALIQDGSNPYADEPTTFTPVILYKLTVRTPRYRWTGERPVTVTGLRRRQRGDGLGSAAPRRRQVPSAAGSVRRGPGAVP